MAQYAYPAQLRHDTLVSIMRNMRDADLTTCPYGCGSFVESFLVRLNRAGYQVTRKRKSRNGR